MPLVLMERETLRACVCVGDVFKKVLDTKYVCVL